MQKFVLTSVSQFINLLQAYPQLASLEEFRFFLPSRDVTPYKAPSSCNCSGKDTAASMNLENKPKLETVMSNLTTDTILKIKAIANLSEFCYYVRNGITGKLELKCF